LIDNSLKGKMKKKLLVKLVTGVLVLGMAGMAQALPVTVSDMQLNGEDADAVAGPISGNDDAATIDALFGGNAWTFIAKDDGPGEEDTGSLGGIDFSLVSTTGTSGTWNLTWNGSGFPVLIDLVAVLKGGNIFAAFLFDNEMLTAPDTNNPDDHWSITFLNNGGNIPGLSHLSLYGRDVVPQNPVPEPATVLLVGTGLAGLAAVRRRKAKKN
jgi:hypothetical protein